MWDVTTSFGISRSSTNREGVVDQRARLEVEGPDKPLRYPKSVGNN